MPLYRFKFSSKLDTLGGKLRYSLRWNQVASVIFNILLQTSDQEYWHLYQSSKDFSQVSLTLGCIFSILTSNLHLHCMFATWYLYRERKVELH